MWHRLRRPLRYATCRVWTASWIAGGPRQPTDAEIMRMIEDVRKRTGGEPTAMWLGGDVAERLGFDPPEPWRPET